MMRRSTETVTVLSILSLTTRPVRTRLGIALSPQAFAAAERCFSFMIVFNRAMSRRTSLMRAVPSCWPVARWKRRLNCSFLRSSSIVPRSSSVFARISAGLVISGLPDAGDEFGADRQLRRAERQRLAREIARHAVDLEHDAAR